MRDILVFENRFLMRAIRSILVIAAACAVTVAFAPNAQAASTWCEPGSGSYSGRCYSLTNTVTSKSVVERVTVHNGLDRNVSFTCGFSKTITKTFSASVTVSTEVKAGIAFLAEGKLGISASVSYTQSASSATSIAGTFTARPGETIYCDRIYTQISTKVIKTTYSGSSVTSSTFTSTMPSSIGISVHK